MHPYATSNVVAPMTDIVLDAVVGLTAQRDLHHLHEQLVVGIRQILGARRVALYGLEGESGDFLLRPLALAPIPDKPAKTAPSLKNKPSFRHCLDQRQPIFTPHNSGEVQGVYPVGDESISGFLVVDGPGQGSGLWPTIAQLLRIYRHLAQLLAHHNRDALTGLFNRSALDQWLDKTLGANLDRRAQDNGTLGCLAVFDIDFFKRINDSLGHLYGDEVLLIFADLLRDTFRKEDFLFRYGGEEFVAIMVNTELEKAMQVLDRFRARVAQHRFPQVNQVTVSIGVTRIVPGQIPTTLFDSADKALYHAKRHGRNQVQAYEWLVAGHQIQDTSPEYKNIELF